MFKRRIGSFGDDSKINIDLGIIKEVNSKNLSIHKKTPTFIEEDSN